MLLRYSTNYSQMGKMPISLDRVSQLYLTSFSVQIVQDFDPESGHGLLEISGPSIGDVV